MRNPPSLVLALLLFAFRSALASTPSFSFHVLTEPTVLDPQLTASASGNYLLVNLYRGLFKYSDSKGLVADGATGCRREKAGRTVICELDRRRKWSNGQPITAADYVNAFRRLIDPDLASPQADVLFTVKNARRIWNRELKSAQLGVVAEATHKLKIELETDDYEFEYKLIHPALSPLPPGGFRDRKGALNQVVSGPYSIEEWKPNTWIKLKNNSHYGPSQRPGVTIYFVEEDATATRLYEAGKLSFLRRVTAADLPRLRKMPGFRQVPVARFDYIGFGPQLESQPKVRAALAGSLDHKLFLKMFDSLSQPGCPGLPAHMVDHMPCQKFDPEEARKAWGEVAIKPKLELHYSFMGGDDISRASEWLQGQWKKHLGIQIMLHGQEQPTYLRELKTNPPTLFRKGVSLDRPTCLAALELFTKGHPDNFIRLDDPEYEKRVAQVASSPTEAARQKACRQALEYLLASNRLIPLGEMKFSIMADDKFAGWSLNSLNQLDLTDLKAVPARH